MSEYIGVLSTKDGCGACVFFKGNTWPGLRAKIEAQGKIPLEEVNFPLPAGKLVPAALLKNNIGWFPSFAVFKKKDWQVALQNPDFHLRGIIFNAKREQNGKIVAERDGLKMDEENVLRWLRNIMTEPDTQYEYIVQAPTDHCSGGGLRSRSYQYGS